MTPVAAEGTYLRDGMEVLIAETAKQWADAVTRLYSDQTLWKNMSRMALAFAHQHYSFKQGQQLMQEALAKVDIFTSPENQSLAAKQARPFISRKV